MADSTTSNFNLVQPQPGASVTTWGSKINTDLSIIDTAMFNNQTAAASAHAAATSAVPLSGGTMTGPLVAPKITVTSAPAGPNDVVRQVDLPTAASPVLVPIGGIVIWPSMAAAPTNWLLCNGSSFSTSTYPALAAVLGTAFGGPGRLPNFNQSLAPGGLDAGNPFFGTIGQSFFTAVGGEEDFGLIAMNFIIRAL